MAVVDRAMTDIEPLYKQLGATIRDLREEAGWTQADLSCQIGLTRASIANVETGRQRLMLHQIVDLADVLGVSVGRIIGQTIEQPSVSGAKYREEISTLKRRVAELETALRDVARRAADAANQ